MSRVYVALDVEATGLNVDRDAIIEIGAVKFREDERLGEWTTLVNPARPLPFRIQQLTGITDAEVRRAPMLNSVKSAFERFVGGATVVGHSVAQDLGYLSRAGVLVGHASIDTFELASILVPFASRYNLATLMDELGIDFPTHHRALQDACAARDLFLALMRRAEDLDLDALREINRLTARIDWPLKTVFQDAERARTRSAFGTSIGAQLRAKGAMRGGAVGLLSGEEELEPLRKARTRTLLDTDSLAALLGPHGAFAQRFPAYEHRPQQVQMLQDVAEVFNDGGYLLVEAGTGTGKSMAYLIPAIYWAAQNGERVVISTNTINLQDQLFAKDLPDLQRVLPIPFRAAVLKGRNNYLCRTRLAAFRRRDDLTTTEVRVLAKILAWLPSSLTGDVGELALMGDEMAVWAKVCSDPDACRPDVCGEGCFYWRARAQAEAAHVVIVNHALLLSDMAVGGQVLPEYDHVIIDEAHHLEARATDQLGQNLTQNGAQALLYDLSHPLRSGAGRAVAEGAGAAGERWGGFLGDLEAILRLSKAAPETKAHFARLIGPLHNDIERANRRLTQIFTLLQRFLEDQLAERRGQTPYDIQIRLTHGVRVSPDWETIEAEGRDLHDQLGHVAEALSRVWHGLDEADFELARHDEWMGELAARRRAILEMSDAALGILAQPRQDMIYWVSVQPRGDTIELNSAPLHVGDLLHQRLFGAKETVVLTSATLRTNEDFAYVRERLGLDECIEDSVGSPFDYEASTLLYLPTDIPEPTQPYFQKRLESALIELCRATEGRTLVLFTSHSQLRQTYRAISQPLGEEGILVLGQGLDGGRRGLLETFKTNERTVLLGTRSFWEGVDVVGEALSCLVVTRLPFDVPSDPVFAARSETFDDPFNQYAIPQAILRFRQGFGRLIRSKNDRGVVVVLDRRLLTKSYGQHFVASLPPTTVRRSPLAELAQAAAQWIGPRRRAATPAAAPDQPAPTAPQQSTLGL
ncbi:MAG: helicase C-terminal domain-containing protein [Anaerolineae bacterium]